MLRQRGLANPWVILAILGIAVVAMLSGGCGSETNESGPEGEPIPTATQEPTFSAEEFFSGKTIRIIDGFSPGGSSDTLARMFIKIAPSHFPGESHFVVENIPGSGGLRGLQDTLRSDPNDPSTFTIGMVHNRFVKRTLAGDPVEGFDLAETRWLGVPDLSATYRALYVRRSVATSWQEVLDSGQEITVGGTEPGSSTGTGAAFIAALGGPVKHIYGYGGTSEIMNAFDRGEIDATTSASEPTVERLYPEWIDNQYFLPVLWWSEPVPKEYLDRLGADEPIHVFDALPLTDEQKTVFDVVTTVNLLSSRTFLVPPGTPDEVYKAVLEAWESTVEDEEFVEAKLIGGFEPGYVSADEIKEILQEAERLSPEGLDFFAELAGVIE